MVDEYNRYTWIFLIATKTDTIVVFKYLLTQVQNVYSTSIKTLRIDNGSKFFSHVFQALLSDLGISHKITCLYTPQ